MTTEQKQTFDIMGHKLVPPHMIISDKERDEILKKYNITPDQLPRILNTDPVAVSIGAKPGQIVKIIRRSQTAKEAVAYRLVVESNE
ncbi:MAG: DNA-directed RNA polymerase subunit H [Candidatus Thermoplasmatota archaeon]|jgi:DNA-directed RNA polymerase subunit H|nr:DNA-directed RNA polymerase subunit H [Candidatus Thermoplasmatota archaeon]